MLTGLSLATNGLTVPPQIKTNAAIALLQSVSNLFGSLIDVPVSYFQGITDIKRADTAARVKLIEATSEAASQLPSEDSNLSHRALYHFAAKIVDEQHNRDEIKDKFIDNINLTRIDRDASSEISSDWLSNFWNIAGTVRNEDLQDLLSKLLIREIIEPNSVTPKTIQITSTLTPKDGRILKKLGDLSIDDGEWAYIIHPHVFAFQNIGPMDEYGLSYQDLFDAHEAGLIVSPETLMLQFSGEPDSGLEEVNYGGSTALFNKTGKQIHMLKFTSVGRDLRNLLPLERVEAYTEALIKKLGPAAFKP